MEALKYLSKAMPFINLIVVLIFLYYALTIAAACADCDAYCLERMGIHNITDDFQNWSWLNESYNG